MRVVIQPEDESDPRAKASIHARELVDKLHQQSDELESDGRFAEGALLARAAEDAGRRVLRLLGKPTSDSEQDSIE